MILLIHIVCAVAGLVSSGALLVRPAKNGFRAAYATIAATILTGSYLVWSTGSPILSACMTGLAYLGVTLSLVAAAHYRANRIQS